MTEITEAEIDAILEGMDEAQLKIFLEALRRKKPMSMKINPRPKQSDNKELKENIRMGLKGSQITLNFAGQLCHLAGIGGTDKVIPITKLLSFVETELVK